MREIKFRGTGVDDGDWVYGSLVIDDQKYYILEKVETVNEYGDGTDFYATDWSEVIDETVGQYTGLKEKNGLEIYEGDVLRDSESIVIVKFVDGEFSVDYRTMGGKWRNYGSLFDYLKDYEGEVIGNVYENYELIKEVTE
jgi:uncharacterized phage protein (TIGR01671 family)